MSKHGCPQLDKFALVKAAVLVLVEHLHQVACHVFVETHLLSDDRRHFLRTQHSVAVLIQVVEARRYLLVAVISLTQR